MSESGSEMAWDLEQVVLERYKIFDIHEGSMGVVLGVDDLQSAVKIAIKIPKLPETPAPTGEHFESEVRFWLALQPHPNIVKAMFVRVIAEQPALFMEYVDGGAYGSLRDWMNGGSITPEDAIRFAHQIAIGMEFANRNGEVAHLDLKPQNLLVTKDSVVKVTDFGLAGRVRLIDGAYPRHASTTWHYAAPELFTDAAGDSRSDIFSLGVILYEMLTAHLPFPFQVSSDHHEAFRQLQEFHVKRMGMFDVAEDIYYHGVPGFEDQQLGFIVSGFLSHTRERRCRSFAKALQNMESAFALPKQSRAPTARTPSDYLEVIASLRLVGRYREALLQLNDMLVAYPEDARFWWEAARTFEASGDAVNARQFEEKARLLDPGLAFKV